MAAWLIVPLYIASICTNSCSSAAPVYRYDDRLDDVLFSIGFGTFAVVGSLLVAKQPANPVGWIMATVALMVAIFPAGGDLRRLRHGHP